MLARILSSATFGIDAYPVIVEVDISRGMPVFSTVGLPDNAVKESKDRVRSAIKNSGYALTPKRITVNLAPAHLKKEGTGFDLPVAVAILKAEGIIKNDSLNDYMVAGELSLDGGIRPVRGALSMAVCAKTAGKKLILPDENKKEAGLVVGVEVYGVTHLSMLVEFLNGEARMEPFIADRSLLFAHGGAHEPDLSEVKGQAHVKRALEVAAAGGHNLLMIGPPGSGKTMLARRLPTILPDMTLAEAIETTKVHSVAGTLSSVDGLVTGRPFRSPHHTISEAGLVGGGKVPRPGEVSLAHNGVLFLDEFPEFSKSAIEVLRQPLEDGMVVISRAAASIAYPAEFMLVGAMNPCPCGFLGDVHKECVCSPLQVLKYRSKLSGPVLDRIDIHCEVPAVRFGELTKESRAEASADVKKRVDAARALQAERLKDKKIFSNSRMTPRQIKKHCEVSGDSHRLLEIAVDKLGLSARAYVRILKVARTIADLDNAEKIEVHHVAEAVQYRTLDRPMV
ncbi:ATP-binding protein [bacterium]|nr:MAG: ATP-binding protein [bacterium]